MACLSNHALKCMSEDKKNLKTFQIMLNNRKMSKTESQSSLLLIDGKLTYTKVSGKKVSLLLRWIS